ncbi:MAG: hypothetical protein AAF984_10865 [Verrucomicrobiota bacterium]
MKGLIHIGAPKTGSTALQNALADSRKRLESHGFLYPEMFMETLKEKYFKRHIFNNHANLNGLFANNPESYFLKKGFKTSQEGEAWLKKQIDYLDAQIAKSQAHTCIISSENLIGTKKLDELHTFLWERFEDLQLLVYVRPPYEAYASSLQERLKNGIPIAKLELPQDYFGHIRGKPDYIKGRLQNYGNKFGFQKLTVVRFDRNRFPENSIVADFAARFLNHDDHPPLNLPETTANPSRPAAPVIFISILANLPELQSNKGKAYLKKLRERLKTFEPSAMFPKFRLSQEWKTLIAHVGLPIYQWIEDKFWEDDSEVLVDRKYIQMDRPADVSQAEFEDWLLGHLTPEGVQQIYQEIFQREISAAQLEKMLRSPRRVKVVRNCLCETLSADLLRF